MSIKEVGNGLHIDPIYSLEKPPIPPPNSKDTERARLLSEMEVV